MTTRLRFREPTEQIKCGLEWAGQVPADWTLFKVGWHLRMSMGWTPPSGNNRYYGGQHNWATIADLTAGRIKNTKSTITDAAVIEKGAVPAPAGSLLFSFKLSIGQTALLDAPSFTNEAIAAFHPNLAIDMSFFRYLAPIALPHSARMNIYGSPLLNQDLIKNARFFAPPITQQRSIAMFLDGATSRIDALIAKKTRFIELLSEKRQALITQAVTKGLDPNVPMKDSGVEWLGEVPADWDTAPLRVFLQQRRDIVGSESKSTKLLSLTLQGVVERDLENPTGKMPASFDTYQRVAAGEMVFCLFDIDETPRTVGIAPQDGMITGAYTVFRPASEIWARYLYYFFLHVDDHKRLKPFYKGMRKTIRPGPFLSIQVPRPSESAAREIADYLDRATARIDTLIAKTERSIELLREHRTALITAAVTGKIDLRDAA